MIAKKIPNPKKSANKSARAGSLANYIVEPEHENGLEKCIHHEADNFLTDTHAAQVAEMVALSCESTRSKDPIDHWVLSWRSDERPTVQQAREAVNIFIKQCGLEGHQAIWGLHDDTKNLHVHIAVNRVHPDTLKVVKINKGFDKEAAQQAVALIEHAQGWVPEKGARYQIIAGKAVRREEKDNKSLEPSTKARAMELQTGEKSAQRIGIEEVAPIIAAARTWRELHDNLKAAGARYERKGSGAIIHVGDVPVKASDVDRKASFSALQKRLGAYQPEKEINSNEYHHHTPQPHPSTLGKDTGNSLRNLSACRLAVSKEGKTRSAGVLHIDARDHRRATDGLRRDAGRHAGDHDRAANGPHLSRPVKPNQTGWNAYQIIKEERRAAKDADTTALRTRQDAKRKELFDKQKAERQELFLPSWAGRGALRNVMQSVMATQHAAEKRGMQEQHKAERTALSAQHAPLVQYKQWQELPHIVGQKAPLPTTDLASDQPKLSQLLRNLSHSTDKRRHVTYTSAGVEVFRDEGKLLAVLDQSSRSIAITLAVAQQKFGQTLTLTGSDAFKRNAVAAAVEHGMSVQFSDPALEALRGKMVEDRRQAERAAQEQARAHALAQEQAKAAQAAAHDRLQVTPAAEPLSARAWLANLAPEKRKPVGDATPENGEVAYTVLYVGPDGVVLNKGRSVTVYPVPAGLDLHEGDKVVVGRNAELGLPKVVAQEKNNLGR